MIRLAYGGQTGDTDFIQRINTGQVELIEVIQEGAIDAIIEAENVNFPIEKVTYELKDFLNNPSEIKDQINNGKDRKSLSFLG
jgi:hypothetical protein